MVHTNVHGQARYKREVITKKLNDPESCISTCHSNETNMMMSATMKNMARLVGSTLQNVNGDELDTPEKEAAFKARVYATTMANMGLLFQDFCTTAKKTDDCFTNCPDSQLKNLTLTQKNQDSTTFCEPGANWSNFTDYWDAVNCTNTTQIDKPCESQCGKEVEVHNVTNLVLDDNNSENGKTKLKYEDDAKKNTVAAGKACKTYSCEFDCYKPIMTQQCGAKAYNLYVRMTKIEPRTSFQMLKQLNAINDSKDCADFI